MKAQEGTYIRIRKATRERMIKYLRSQPMPPSQTDFASFAIDRLIDEREKALSK